jgi:hypothetical protein
MLSRAPAREKKPGTTWINDVAATCSTLGRSESNVTEMQQSRGFGLSAKLVRELHIASICTIPTVVVIIMSIVIITTTIIAVILSPAVSPASA